MAIYCKKTVYEAPASEDGMRLVVMRRYPRGVSKSRVHAWVPALAPSLPLVHWYHEQLKAIEAQWKRSDPDRHQQEIARFWKIYSGRYCREMKEQRHLIAFLASLQRNFDLSFTLLCACPDYRICHRGLLAELIAAVPAHRSA
ncbi:MAG: DUF488 domain-containing protein [Gammaproteobacteria bacterium]